MKTETSFVGEITGGEFIVPKSVQLLQDWANQRVKVDMIERSKKSTLVYESKLLGTFKSQRDNTLYKVTSKGNLIYCTCPGYYYRKACKHTKAI
jgi:hypothetical protein